MNQDTLTVIPEKMIPRTLVICDGYDHYVIDDPDRVRSMEQLAGELRNRGISDDFIVDVLMPYIDRDRDRIGNWCGRNNLNAKN